MGILENMLGWFSSSDTPAVPLPDGTKTGQASTSAASSKPRATQAPVMQTASASKSSKATKATKAAKATKAQPETTALFAETGATAQPATEAEKKANAVKHTVANEQTIERMRKMYDDTFSVYNSDGTLNVKATLEEFNNQKAMGLLDEKRDMKDWSDKRNWDDALKMLANWAPQGPTVLFRGQGGNKIYQRK